MGIRANRQSIPNVSTNPWFRERSSLSASNGRIYSPTGPLRSFAGQSGPIRVNLFPMVRALSSRHALRCIDRGIPVAAADPSQSRMAQSFPQRVV